MNNLDKKLINLMAAVFKVQPSKIDKRITNRDIENWDSLRQINLVSAIEVEFKIEISIEEAAEMLSYNIISKIIREKIKDD
jgi:acyl carrier protein